MCIDDEVFRQFSILQDHTDEDDDKREKPDDERIGTPFVRYGEGSKNGVVDRKRNERRTETPKELIVRLAPESIEEQRNAEGKPSLWRRSTRRPSR